jgi:hypothetical protein
MFTSAYNAQIADSLSDYFTLKFLQKPYRFADLFAEIQKALSEPPRVISAGTGSPV